MIMAYLGFLAKNKDLISCQKYVAIVQRKHHAYVFRSAKEQLALQLYPGHP